MNLDEFIIMESNGDSNSSNLVDLRGLKHASMYNDHLMCPICYCPFIQPVRLHCDHVFCQDCLTTAITCTIVDPASSMDLFKCPSCRVPAREVFLNVPRLLINMCNEVQVKCPFVHDGCYEIMPRSHVQAHVDKYCGYPLVDCPDKACDEKLHRKDLDAFGDRCLHAIHECPSCGEDVMELDSEVCRYMSI